MFDDFDFSGYNQNIASSLIFQAANIWFERLFSDLPAIKIEGEGEGLQDEFKQLMENQFFNEILEKLKFAWEEQRKAYRAINLWSVLWW